MIEVRHLLDAAGAPGWATAHEPVEAVLNAGLFLPAGALAVVAMPRPGWPVVVVVGFVVSVAVESVQGALIDGRTTQTIDVVANTAGALTGALVGRAVVRRNRESSGRSGDPM